MRTIAIIYFGIKRPDVRTPITAETDIVVRLVCFVSLLTFLFLQDEAKGQRVDSCLNFDMSNPAMMAGSDLGNLIQRLYICGKFDEMLKFTSKYSRIRFGDKAITDYYRRMEFGTPLKLKSKYELEGTIWLTYETTIEGTVRVIRIPVVVESDTARILLRNLWKSLIKQAD